jgi:vacuolar-type H+-ATPase subunit F/Vma7
MGRVAVIGEALRISGYGLAGAVLCPAADEEQVIKAWRDLPADVAVAVFTPAAARWLSAELGRRPAILPVVLPEVAP